jgi:hypothetical protein
MLTIATVINDHVSASLMYPIDWTGCDGTEVRFRTILREAATADWLTEVLAVSRQDCTCGFVLRKEDNSCRVVIYEQTAEGAPCETPEHPDSPCLVLCGPKAQIKIRVPSIEAYDACVMALYQVRMKFTECLPTREWDRVGAFEDGVTSGEIPIHPRITPPPEALAQFAAFDQRIHGAGLKTQNYDKGLDRSIRKFKHDSETQATMAIAKGFHEDHGSAVYLTQGKRRCLSLNTTYGLSDDDALWKTLADWACFQPRRGAPRVVPGTLFYPGVLSHVFEKYWDYLPNLGGHPDFTSETQYCQEQMNRFSSTLSTMDLRDFRPSPAAEAKQSDLETAEDAEISRLRPLQDGLELWEILSGSGDRGYGAPAPG